MSKELQVANNTLPATTSPQTVIHNSGDNVTQIANNQGGTINVFMPAANGAVYNAATKISSEYYNLFVIGGESFNENFFLIDKERALTVAEGVAEEISAQFASLTPDAQAAIKTFPSIFASETVYGDAGACQLALFGVVTDIRIQENGIKVYFQRFCTIPQRNLNELARNLALKGTPTFNELSRTHWTIKRINLIEELRAAGITVLAPI